MITTRTNLTCAACKLAHNGINGRYCNLLGRYVEYDTQPPCKTIKKQ